MGDEGSGCSTAGYGLQDGGFHLQVTFFIEQIPQGGVNLCPLSEEFSGLGIDNQVHVTLTVTVFSIGDRIINLTISFLHNGQGFDGFTQDGHLLYMDR